MHGTSGKLTTYDGVYMTSMRAESFKDPNKVRSVFLLTDGNANVGKAERL